MMFKYNTVIAIRTHSWTDAEQDLYIKLLEYFSPENIFVVVDEIKKLVDVPDYIQKVSLNIEYLRNNVLISEIADSPLGWWCGDYFYYAFLDAVEAKYYWLIEPDVSFTFQDLKDFFLKFENDDADAFLHNFSKADDSWYWTQRAKIIDENVYKSFFPLSRLSYRAILHCKQERQNISKYFFDNELSSNMYPNDESLVATVVMKSGLNIKPLNFFHPNSFLYFSYKKLILGENVKNLLPSNQVIHPFRQPEYLGCLLASDVEPMKLEDRWLELIGNAILSEKDINRVLCEIQEKFLSNVCSVIKSTMIHESIMTDVQRYFNYVSNLYSNEEVLYKSWKWEDATLVLDAYINSGDYMDNIYTLECVFNDNDVTCNVFVRKGDDSFIDFMIKKNPTASKIGDKLSLIDDQNIGLGLGDKSIIIDFIHNVKKFINCE